jgi:preprotein translocase subunit SecG
VELLIGLLNVLLIVGSLFLICLVLIQRGKGGGLAGAFGGAGGSSAFGTKAGDVFTTITVVTALVWILLAMIQVLLMNRAGRTSAYQGAAATAPSEVPGLPGVDLGADLPGAGAGSGTPAPSTPPAEPATDPGLPPAIGDTPPAATPAATPPADAPPTAPAVPEAAK